MSTVSTNDFKQGMKIEVDNEPYTITNCEFVKPGKGQAFTRTKLKHLMTGRVLERTFKSGEKFPLADVVEANMRLLYREGDDAVFMDDNTFDQVTVPLGNLGDQKKWLKDDIVYALVFYKDSIVDVAPPTFMELVITETAPGARGDTASGRVLKPAVVETGAEIQIPIFVDEGEKIKVDTRTGEYVSRV
ncbi:MAG: elongation factor P [Chlamydiales bacterium]|nr:elongation factor P [Chlamydiales bacterium]